MNLTPAWAMLEINWKLINPFWITKNQIWHSPVSSNIRKMKKLNIFINDEKLDQKCYAKYLPVYIDKNLSFTKDIKNN